jgi:hypothetical protein
MSTLSNAYGLFSSTGTNQDANTFDDEWPHQSQDFNMTNEANALVDDLRD